MNIIELAKQAELIQWDTLPSGAVTPNHESVANARKFAHLVRTQTLDEAAGVCENTLAHHYMKQVTLTHDQALLLAACADCAGAISKLKEMT